MSNQNNKRTAMSIVIKRIAVAMAAVATTLAVSLCSPTTAEAIVVNVDLGDAGAGGPYSGSGVIGTGTFWTESVAASETNLLADDGVTNSGFGFVRSGGGAGGVDASIDLFDDYFNFAATSTLTINGLSDASTYNLVLYGAQNFNPFFRGAEFIIGGVSKTTSGDNGGSAFVEGNSYVRYDGLSPVSGEIAITFALPEGVAIMNGFQIEVVPAPAPEPSSFVLAGLAFVGLALRRRRRSRA